MSSVWTVISEQPPWEGKWRIKNPTLQSTSEKERLTRISLPLLASVNAVALTKTSQMNKCAKGNGNNNNNNNLTISEQWIGKKTPKVYLIKSGLHAFFLSLIRINSVSAVFHNQKSWVISQKLCHSKLRRKQDKYLSSINWFCHICCICHTHNLFSISQNILYCHLDANLQGRRWWRKEKKLLFTSLSIDMRQNRAVFINPLHLKGKR